MRPRSGILMLMALGIMFGVVFVFLGISGIISDISKTKEYKATIGIVTSIGEYQNNRGELLYKPEIEYKVNGLSYKYMHELATGVPSFNIGEKVVIKYNPNNPEDSMLGEFDITNNKSVFALVLGLLFLIITSAWLIITLKNIKNEKYEVSQKEIIVHEYSGEKNLNSGIDNNLLAGLAIGFIMPLVTGYILWIMLKPVIYNKLSFDDLIIKQGFVVIVSGFLFIVTTWVFLYSFKAAFLDKSKQIRAVLYRINDLSEISKAYGSKINIDGQYLFTFISEEYKSYTMYANNTENYTIGDTYELDVKGDNINEISLSDIKCAISTEDDLQNKINKKKYNPIFYMPNGSKIEGLMLIPITIVIFVPFLISFIFSKGWSKVYTLPMLLVTGFMIGVNIYYRYINHKRKL